MRTLLPVVLLTSTACDDTVFGKQAPESYEPTWDGMEQFFVAQCDSCHPSLQGIDLHEDVRADVEDAALYYVVPGDPDASRIWQVVSDPDDDLLMPFGASEPLPDETIEHVSQWIEDGAEL